MHAMQKTRVSHQRHGDGGSALSLWATRNGGYISSVTRGLRVLRGFLLSIRFHTQTRRCVAAFMHRRVASLSLACCRLSALRSAAAFWLFCRPRLSMPRSIPFPQSNCSACSPCSIPPKVPILFSFTLRTHGGSECGEYALNTDGRVATCARAMCGMIMQGAVRCALGIRVVGIRAVDGLCDVHVALHQLQLGLLRRRLLQLRTQVERAFEEAFRLLEDDPVLLGLPVACTPDRAALESLKFQARIEALVRNATRFRTVRILVRVAAFEVFHELDSEKRDAALVHLEETLPRRPCEGFIARHRSRRPEEVLRCLCVCTGAAVAGVVRLAARWRWDAQPMQWREPQR